MSDLENSELGLQELVYCFSLLAERPKPRNKNKNKTLYLLSSSVPLTIVGKLRYMQHKKGNGVMVSEMGTRKQHESKAIAVGLCWSGLLLAGFLFCMRKKGWGVFLYEFWETKRRCWDEHRFEVTGCWDSRHHMMDVTENVPENLRICMETFIEKPLLNDKCMISLPKQYS